MSDIRRSPTAPLSSVSPGIESFRNGNGVAVSDLTPVGRPWVRLGLDILCAVVLFLSAAEVAVRLDDRIRGQIPILANPDRVADLVVHDRLGIRGKPNGRYKRWQLNSFGFRGDEISEVPASGSIRVMTLGASETFGLYESDNHEYPAQLAAQLRTAGPFEVVNASLFGLTLPAIRQNWTNWASRFQPKVVTVYPTPAFYLGERAPGPPGTPPPSSTADWKSRFSERLKDRIEVPDVLQRRRVARALSELEAEHPPTWFFTAVPRERLEQFERDLELLVADIQRTGATVLLMTHATSFATHVREEDRAQLNAWRQLTPRPSIQVLLDFEHGAQEATLRVADRNRVPVVDLAGRMSGDKRWFASDGLHFNDSGAQQVAALIADAILERDR